jgi:hypothetical protein
MPTLAAAPGITKGALINVSASNYRRQWSFRTEELLPIPVNGYGWEPENEVLCAGAVLGIELAPEPSLETQGFGEYGAAGTPGVGNAGAVPLPSPVGGITAVGIAPLPALPIA